MPTDEAKRISRLNQAAAKEVMGWSEYARKDLEWKDGRWHGEGCTPYVTEWTPATDMGDAWRLVEKLEGEGYKFTVYSDEAWVSEWRGDAEDGGLTLFPVAHADGDGPEAVTKAALEVVREEEGWQ